MSYDVVIAGGGLVGASLALALDQIGLRVTLIEAAPFKLGGSPSFDERTTALSNGSRRIFEAMGAWAFMQHEASPIRRIHVSDQGRFGFARIDAVEQGLDAIGHVVPNRVMGAALWRRIEQTSIQLLAPARVTGYQPAADACLVDVAQSGEALVVNTRLLVAADGAESAIRKTAGVGATTWDYGQTALVTTVTTQKFHDHVAYERFTATGPLALLPLTEGRVGLVWTLPPEAATEVRELNDAAFIERLQAAFGMRLGRFLRVGQRYCYPLTLTRADDQVAPRLAILGNAAQGLHPIAGQGFNLGLRDVATLAELLAEAQAAAHASGANVDAGNATLLARYSEWRRQDRERIIAFTDGLVRVFSHPFAPVRWLRDAVLLGFDLSPDAKDALSQLSLGAAGRVPKLARGAPL